MGTRGLFFVRFRGRYYVYYNHWDSYPEGLGEAIVQRIPEDPDEYRKWLQMMRARFSELSEQYEERCLPVSVTGDQPESTVSLPGRYQKSFLSVDDRLGSPPLQFTPETRNLFIEWTYTLDLDREVFTVDETLHFKMTKIPRFGDWIKYVGADGHDRRAFTTNTPKELIGDVSHMPQINRASQDRYKALGPDVVPPTSLVPDSEVAIHREAFFGLIFSRAHNGFFSILDQLLPEWDSGSFAFRELAFAFLSIAAGEVSFVNPKSLNGNYSREGYFVIPEANRQNSQQPLLPLFLRENHAPGMKPGSAPKGTTYWMNNVLVHLATRTDLVEVEEAAVADVVEFGLNAGAKNYYAMVFSILDVVLIRVQINQDGSAHVRRSPLMALIYFSDKNSYYVNGPRSRVSNHPPGSNMGANSDQASEGKGSGDEHSIASDVEDMEIGGKKDKNNTTVVKESYEDEYFTFSMMLRFFDAASKEYLAGEKSCVFPNEIMSIIMDFSDLRTHHTLRKVSACCQQVGIRKIRLNDYYAVVGADRRQAAERFRVENLRTGEKITSRVSYNSGRRYSLSSRNKTSYELHPIFGIADASSDRATIVETISLFFPELSVLDPEYKEQVELPFSEQHTSSYGSMENSANELFEMPAYLYPGSVEKAWGQYITAVIRGGENSAFRYMMINHAQWPCLLPPRYRELRTEHMFLNGLRAFLRHPSDECPVEWEQTVNYAIAQLGLTESTRRRDGHIKGRLVLVAFGTSARLFYYVYHRHEAPTVPPNPRPHSVRVAEACTNPEGRRRLVELIPGTINIREPSDRTELEKWLMIFGGDEGFGKEWDPITESRHRIGGDMDNTEPDNADADPQESDESAGDEGEAENEERSD